MKIGRNINSSRNIKIVRKLTIIKTVGLKRSDEDNPFLWHSSYTGKRPFWIRFVWNPQTGRMILGVPLECYHHKDIIPSSRRYPIDAWVRGFYFPEKRWIGIRPFFWPAGPEDQWNKQHATLNDRIMKALVPMLRRILPKARIETNIDNNRLAELTGLLDW